MKIGIHELKYFHSILNGMSVVPSICTPYLPFFHSPLHYSWRTHLLSIIVDGFGGSSVHPPTPSPPHCLMLEILSVDTVSSGRFSLLRQLHVRYSPCWHCFMWEIQNGLSHRPSSVIWPKRFSKSWTSQLTTEIPNEFWNNINIVKGNLCWCQYIFFSTLP